MEGKKGIGKDTEKVIEMVFGTGQDNTSAHIVMLETEKKKVEVKAETRAMKFEEKWSKFQKGDIRKKRIRILDKEIMEFGIEKERREFLQDK